MQKNTFLYFLMSDQILSIESINFRDKKKGKI